MPKSYKFQDDVMPVNRPGQQRTTRDCQYGGLFRDVISAELWCKQNTALFSAHLLTFSQPKKRPFITIPIPHAYRMSIISIKKELTRNMRFAEWIRAVVTPCEVHRYETDITQQN
ncbi:hypothetical protein DUI87_04253 [Hirundo rustica rustica]|uniref:Uncharacterized protein n=1 Tax=Hirundo rustica rustica TaxID=333673 RepID=A0A3M0LH12_HIRRU|nr:hypothetical protein DUI87_04253 [Hirundo rustica rustica]